MTRDIVVERMNTHAGQTLAGVFGGLVRLAGDPPYEFVGQPSQFA